ncbi:MAG TPA: PTS transporter subunit EIIA [Clostridiales bacterium]|nr:PTS transporter subunit EIIA [Clostridiales bacterium]
MKPRQVSLLSILYHADDYMVMHELAERQSVSERTVRADLYDIKSKNPSLKLLTKPNKGVRLLISQEEFEQLISERIGSLPLDSHEEKRAEQFALLLLKNAPCTLEKITERLYLSRSTAIKVLDETEAWLRTYNISLVRRRGQGLSVSYDEVNWRRVMWELFLRLYHQDSNRNSLEMVCEQIRIFMDGFESVPLIFAIRTLEEQYGFVLSYGSRIELLFYMSVAVVRMRKGKAVEVELLPDKEIEDTLEHKLALELSDYIRSKYILPIPPGEYNALVCLVSRMEIQDFVSAEKTAQFMSYYPRYVDLTHRIIQLAISVLEVDFSSDEFLQIHLLLYLRAAIARMMQGIKVHNPLLDQIKERYPTIFAAAWSLSVLFEADLNLDINEAEVGFLALHFGGAIERVSLTNRVLILCNYGVSVSRLLQAKLEKKFPGIIVEDVISTADEEKARHSTCDFIIATIPVGKHFGGKEVIVVDNFLAAHDISALEKKMKGLRSIKRRKITGEKEIENRLELFRPEFIFLDVKVRSKKDLLSDMCGKLVEHGYVTPEFCQTVLEREEITSTEAGSGVAIPHGASKYVKQSVISVAVLQQPLAWYGDAKIDLLFLLAADLSGDKPGKQELLQFYAAFAALVEHPQSLQRVKDMASPEELAGYMNNIVRGGYRINENDSM